MMMMPWHDFQKREEERCNSNIISTSTAVNIINITTAAVNIDIDGEWAEGEGAVNDSGGGGNVDYIDGGGGGNDVAITSFFFSFLKIWKFLVDSALICGF